MRRVDGTVGAILAIVVGGTGTVVTTGLLFDATLGRGELRVERVTVERSFPSVGAGDAIRLTNVPPALLRAVSELEQLELRQREMQEMVERLDREGALDRLRLVAELRRAKRDMAGELARIRRRMRMEVRLEGRAAPTSLEIASEALQASTLVHDVEGSVDVLLVGDAASAARREERIQRELRALRETLEKAPGVAIERARLSRIARP